jgi:hypothetical protein
MFRSGGSHVDNRKSSGATIDGTGSDVVAAGQ